MNLIFISNFRKNTTAPILYMNNVPIMNSKPKFKDISNNEILFPEVLEPRAIPASFLKFNMIGRLQNSKVGCSSCGK